MVEESKRECSGGRHVTLPFMLCTHTQTHACTHTHMRDSDRDRSGHTGTDGWMDGSMVDVRERGREGGGERTRTCAPCGTGIGSRDALAIISGLPYWVPCY